MSHAKVDDGGQEDQPRKREGSLVSTKQGTRDDLLTVSVGRRIFRKALK